MIIIDSSSCDGTSIWDTVLANVPRMLPYILLAAAVGVAVYGLVKLVKFIIQKKQEEKEF